MKNWIEGELELFFMIVSMRGSILFIPLLGVVIGMVLTVYLDHSLTSYISNNPNSIYQSLVEKVFAKLYRRVDYFFYLGSIFLFLKNYLRERKRIY